MSNNQHENEIANLIKGLKDNVEGIKADINGLEKKIDERFREMEFAIKSVKLDIREDMIGMKNELAFLQVSHGRDSTLPGEYSQVSGGSALIEPPRSWRKERPYRR